MEAIDLNAFSKTWFKQARLYSKQNKLPGGV